MVILRQRHRAFNHHFLVGRNQLLAGRFGRWRRRLGSNFPVITTPRYEGSEFTMWHNAHHGNPHGGNDCSDPGRERFGGNHEQHHGGGWGEHGVFNGPGWGGDCGRLDDPGWGGLGDCHDDRGFGGFGDCHDGGRGLIGFDHNSILACH